MPKRFDRTELRRFSRGINPKKDTDQGRKSRCGEDNFGVNDGFHIAHSHA